MEKLNKIKERVKRITHSQRSQHTNIKLALMGIVEFLEGINCSLETAPDENPEPKLKPKKTWLESKKKLENE